MVDFKWIICLVFLAINNQQTCNGFFIYKYPNHELSECGQSKVSKQTRIIDGEDAQPGQYPWMVRVVNENFGGAGGGVLIYDRWVLSCGHGLVGDEQEMADYPSIWTVRVGSRDKENGTIYNVEQIFGHPNWNRGQFPYHNDIALLKTTEPIRMTKGSAPEPVNIICLPDDHAEPRNGQLVATGWGNLYSADNYETPRILKTVKLDVISDEQCQAMQHQAYADGINTEKNQILPSQICTWTKNKSTCGGDSGGPLIDYVDGHAVLIGITSYGTGCASDYPAVFTQVSHFIDWMAETIMNNV